MGSRYLCCRTSCSSKCKVLVKCHSLPYHKNIEQWWLHHWWGWIWGRVCLQRGWKLIWNSFIGWSLHGCHQIPWSWIGFRTYCHFSFGDRQHNSPLQTWNQLKETNFRNRQRFWLNQPLRCINLNGDQKRLKFCRGSHQLGRSCLFQRPEWPHIHIFPHKNRLHWCTHWHHLH